MPSNEFLQKILETLESLRAEVQQMKVEVAVEKAVNRIKWGVVIAISSGIGSIAGAVVVFFLKK